jgi:hypothetical protein
MLGPGDRRANPGRTMQGEHGCVHLCSAMPCARHDDGGHRFYARPLPSLGDSVMAQRECRSGDGRSSAGHGPWSVPEGRIPLSSVLDAAPGQRLSLTGVPPDIGVPLR